MAPDGNDHSIRTTHLELVLLRNRFVEALVAADRAAAGVSIGARVSGWLTADPSHVVQLRLAAQSGEAAGFPGLARIIVLSPPGRIRRAIGSIGFHGPPDERGRLELGCRLSPAHRGRGYAAEAMMAMTDWATATYGVTRFLVAVPSEAAQRDLVAVEISGDRDAAVGERLGDLGSLIELRKR